MIKLTDAAKLYIQKYVEKNASLGFRLSVKKTGCSGYSYEPSLVQEVNVHDVALEIEGIKLYLDTAWLDLLEAVQIDYVEENKSGIKQKRLIFTNEKEASRCGCGESFHVEKP